MPDMQPPSEDRAQELYLESLTGQITGWNNPRQRLAQAFDRDEFILYQQSIRPVARESAFDTVEILIRHQDEEKHLTPPGAFLPLLEYYEMMPLLDQWVTRHVLRWSQGQKRAKPLRFFINTALGTLTDVHFAQFVRDQLSAAGVSGEALCYEVPENHVLEHGEAVRPVARALQGLGCATAVGSVGRQSVSFKPIQAIAANYVKFDGSLVREIHRDPVAHAKAQAVNRVCQLAGIRTVAEFVEEEETLEKLRGIGVDYAQGFGISRPGPLSALE